jgi:predicted GNAT family acetyltransferase
MTGLPEHLFANPVWSALHSNHRHFADFAGDACRYPADVVPFISVRTPNPNSMREVHSLLAPNESTWLIAEHYPQIPELIRHETLDCFQMALPENVAPPPETANNVVPLSDVNAEEMVALTNLAFPGFYRQRTCEMGSYVGVRSPAGELIAMGGERLQIDGFTELSAVCTHPSFRGQGHAANIMWQLVRNHRNNGIASWLHVGCPNAHAIQIYLHMGFEIIRKLTLHRISRRDAIG